MSAMRRTAQCWGALFLVGALATADDGSLACQAIISARCSVPTGDSVDCLFGLQVKEGSGSQALPPVRVAFMPDPAYTVSPVAVQLDTGTTVAATITLNRAAHPLGVIQLRGRATGLPLECAMIDRPLDFSQPGTFRIEVMGTGVYADGSGPQDAWLVPGRAEQLEVRVLDSSGQLVKGMPVPLTLLLSAFDASAEFYQPGGPVSEAATVLLPAGDASQLLLMRSLKPGTGRLQVVAKLHESGRTLASTVVHFRSEHTWGRRFRYALLGGLFFWLLRVVRFVSGARWTMLLAGASLFALAETLLASGIGFAVHNYLPQLGISFRADPSRLDGQIFLGMLLAGFGTEGLLGLVKGRAAGVAAPARRGS